MEKSLKELNNVVIDKVRMYAILAKSYNESRKKF